MYKIGLLRLCVQDRDVQTARLYPHAYGSLSARLPAAIRAFAVGYRGLAARYTDGFVYINHSYINLILKDSP